MKKFPKYGKVFCSAPIFFAAENLFAEAATLLLMASVCIRGVDLALFEAVDCPLSMLLTGRRVSLLDFNFRGPPVIDRGVDCAFLGC